MDIPGVMRRDSKGELPPPTWLHSHILQRGLLYHSIFLHFWARTGFSLPYQGDNWWANSGMIIWFNIEQKIKMSAVALQSIGMLLCIIFQLSYSSAKGLFLVPDLCWAVVTLQAEEQDWDSLCLCCWLKLQHRTAKLLRKNRAWGSASSGPGSWVCPDCSNGSISPASKLGAEVPLPERSGDWPEMPFSDMILPENKQLLAFRTASFQLV